MWAVEARAGARLSDAELQRLRERLARCEGEVVVDEDGIHLGFRLEAERLTEAVAEALIRLEGKLPIVQLSVMTLAELQRARERNQLPDVVGIVDIQELAGLGSKQRALQVTRLPTFPAPALQTRAGRLWTQHSRRGVPRPLVAPIRTTPERKTGDHDHPRRVQFIEMKELGHVPMSESGPAFKRYITPVLEEIRSRALASTSR